jgi:hypothetical protein
MEYALDTHCNLSIKYYLGKKAEADQRGLAGDGIMTLAPMEI